MIRIKEGVKLQGRKEDGTIVRIHPELNFLLQVADKVYAMQGAECVITSVFDGKHMRQSKHYEGKAVDLRIWNLENALMAKKEIQRRVGLSFQIILEKDHIHAEYDPEDEEYAEVE